MPQYSVSIRGSIADTIKQYIEEDLARFIDWCKANNIYSEDEAEAKAAELLDSLEA